MKRTVLIVDDEANMQAVMRMILEDAGHEVLVADSGESGIIHLENPNLDVVLSDLKMPGMGGEGFIGRSLRQRPIKPSPPMPGIFRSDNTTSRFGFSR